MPVAITWLKAHGDPSPKWINTPGDSHARDETGDAFAETFVMDGDFAKPGSTESGLMRGGGG